MLLETDVLERKYAHGFQESAAVSTKPTKPASGSATPPGSNLPKSLDQLIVDESCRMFTHSVEIEAVPEMRRAMSGLFDIALQREKSMLSPH